MRRWAWVGLWCAWVLWYEQSAMSFKSADLPTGTDPRPRYKEGS